MTQGTPRLAVILLLLAGCAPAAQDAPAPPRLAAPESTSAASAAEGVGANSSLAPDARPTIALDGEGLRLLDPATGESRLVAFGTSAEEVASLLSRALPGEQRSAPQETDCGDAVVIGSSGLDTHQRDGQFLGWSVDEASALETGTGLGIGDTRAELEAARSVEVMESTIGVEFVSDDIAGLLESKADDARVTHLWAGETCIAR